MVNKWEIYFCMLDLTVGSEQRGKRSALVISNDAVNHVLPIVTILPISSVKSDETIYPTEVLLPIESSNLSKLSVAMIQQIRTISKERLVNKAGKIDDDCLKTQIEESSRRYFEL